MTEDSKSKPLRMNVYHTFNKFWRHTKAICTLTRWASLFRSRIESYQSTITAHKCLCIHSQNGPVSSPVYVRAERESNSDGSDSHTNCLRYGRVAATDKLPHWFESLANMRCVDKRTCIRLFSILYAECLFTNQPAE